MSIKEYFSDWSKVVDIKSAEYILSRLVKSKALICPKSKDVFKAFTKCKFKDLRVVIIGQDPYPTLRNKVPVATGIAFANSKDTLEKDYSSSLEVLMESVIDFTRPHDCINFDPSLEKWESQGVLLINSALTCEVGKIGSHTLLWRPFIRSFLTNLSKNSCGIVYVLMGKDAQSFESYINPRYNHIIKTRHPSYYARSNTKMSSDIWNQINQILIGQNGYGIKWYKEINYLKENEKVFYEGN